MGNGIELHGSKTWTRWGGWESHSSGVDASVLSSGHDKALASEVETFGEGFVLGLIITLDNLGKNLQLVRFQLWTFVSIGAEENTG